MLVKELKENFKQHNLLLTSAFGAAKNVIDLAYDVSTLSKYLDYMHIMCYDYGGSWDKRVTANAPLSSDDALNVEFTIEYLIKMGASPSKIVMGIPFYGRTFITEGPGNFGDASTDVGFMGPYTRENGFMGYNELCVLLSNTSSRWTKSWDAAKSQGVAKQLNIETGETKVAVFDSARSVANKMRFVMSQDLGGAMVWSVDTDDFLGDCEIELDTYDDFGKMAGVKLSIPRRVNANYPLLRTINEALIIAEDEIEQENVIKESEAENEIPHGDVNEHSNGGSSGVYGSALLACALSSLLRTMF